MDLSSCGWRMLAWEADAGAAGAGVAADFEAELGRMPPVLHGPCCAEFLVKRERVLAHPRHVPWHFVLNSSPG